MIISSSTPIDDCKKGVDGVAVLRAWRTDPAKSIMRCLASRFLQILNRSGVPGKRVYKLYITYDSYSVGDRGKKWMIRWEHRPGTLGMCKRMKRERKRGRLEFDNHR